MQQNIRDNVIIYHYSDVKAYLQLGLGLDPQQTACPSAPATQSPHSSSLSLESGKKEKMLSLAKLYAYDLFPLCRAGHNRLLKQNRSIKDFISKQYLKTTLYDYICNGSS